MTADEYRQLREEHNQDWVIDELQRRSLEKGLAAYNLRSLRESLLKDQTIASRTHQVWQPPEVWDIFIKLMENSYITNSRNLFPPTSVKHIR